MADDSPATTQAEGPPVVILIGVSTTAVWHARASLIRALLAAKTRVVVFATDDGAKDQLEAMPCTVEAAPSSASMAGLVRAIRPLRKQIARDRTALVHVFGWRPALLYLVARVGLGARPTVLTFTGLGALRERGSLVARSARLGLRALARGSDIVTTQNPDDSRLLRRWGVVSEGAITTLPGSGIDTGSIAEVPRPTQDRVTFMMMSRLIRKKGVLTFIEAAKLVHSRWDAMEEPDAQRPLFRLVGGVAPGADRLAPASWTSNPGELSWTAVGEAIGDAAIERAPFSHTPLDEIAAADVVVLPTEYGEGLPRSLIEAAAVGRASITTSVAGARDAVVDGVTGLIVPPGDAAALAEAMVRLAGDRDLVAAMGRSARKRAVEWFDDGHILAGYWRAYEAASAAAGGGP